MPLQPIHKSVLKRSINNIQTFVIPQKLNTRYPTYFSICFPYEWRTHQRCHCELFFGMLSIDLLNAKKYRLRFSKNQYQI